MQLAFVPLNGALVPVPGELTSEGQPPRRVCAMVKRGEWVFLSSPLTVESTSREAAGLIRMAQRGDLAAADVTTAVGCGVSFEPVEFVGEREGWRVAKATSESRVAAKES